MLQKALLITVPWFPKYIQQLMGCCSTENFQFSRWWAVTQYSYWYISMHHPFIFCAGKSSLPFLPPELTKNHPVSAGLICHTTSCPVHLRPDQVKALLLQYFTGLAPCFSCCQVFLQLLRNAGHNLKLSKLDYTLVCCPGKSEWWAQRSFTSCQGSL